MTDADAAMKELGRVTARLDKVEKERDQLRDRATELIVTALRLEVPPTDVTNRGPFSSAHVRKLARDHDIPPARPGVKPRKRAAGDDTA